MAPLAAEHGAPQLKKKLQNTIYNAIWSIFILHLNTIIIIYHNWRNQVATRLGKERRRLFNQLSILSEHPISSFIYSVAIMQICSFLDKADEMLNAWNLCEEMQNYISL